MCGWGRGLYKCGVMNQHSSSDTISSSVGPEAISRRAYELWENEGRPEGCEMRHWLQAEQELSSGNRSTSSTANGGSTGSSAPSRNSDVTPLQGTRAGAAAASSARDPKRATPPASYSSEKNGGNGQNAARRKPASAPAL